MLSSSVWNWRMWLFWVSFFHLISYSFLVSNHPLIDHFWLPVLFATSPFHQHLLHFLQLTPVSEKCYQLLKVLVVLIFLGNIRLFVLFGIGYLGLQIVWNCRLWRMRTSNKLSPILPRVCLALVMFYLFYLLMFLDHM